MREGTCRYCGQEGFWSWAYYKQSPILVVDNRVHKCTNRDIFPGWCTECKRTDLLLVRKKAESVTSTYIATQGTEFQLIENYGLPHTCTENGCTDIEDMSETKCKHCSTSGLFWVSVRRRWTLRAADGTKHTCQQYSTLVKEWAEALRMDYAFEKAWVNSKTNNYQCKKCKGKGHKTFESRNKRLMQKYLSSEPITVYRQCKHCKHLGTFTPSVKNDYLKNLRKKYWPFYPGTHKWKKGYG